MTAHDDRARDEQPARAGHTWEIRIRERGSSSVVGEPGYHDSADWYELRTQTVRAWSLAAALDAARALPLMAWLDNESCCDLHGRNCEPPSELCCHGCSEAAHPLHADGSTCSSPDLSRACRECGSPVHRGRCAAPTTRETAAGELAEAEPRYGAYDGDHWGLEDGLREENTQLREHLAERGRERDAARAEVERLRFELDEARRERAGMQHLAQKNRDELTAAQAAIQRVRAMCAEIQPSGYGGGPDLYATDVLLALDGGTSLDREGE